MRIMPIKRSFKIFTLTSVISLLLFIQTPGLNAQEAGSYDSGKLVDRTVSAVGRHYYNPSRIEPRKMFDESLKEIQRLVPDVIIKDGGSGQVQVTAGLASKRIKIRSTDRLSGASNSLVEILDFVTKHYDSSDEIKPNEIEYASIDGLLGVLDPHSNFLTPKIYKEFRIGTSGKFGGLGIVISIKDGFLTVIAPLEGTPAFGAGIEAGDRIMQIEDESTINMSLTDAVNKLRGDVGTRVTVLIERSGQPPKKITLKRAVINIDSVQPSLLAENGKRIGYIKLKNFQDNTDDDVRVALKEFHKDGATLDGLILDLRNNPGGLLNVASDVADMFLTEGVIVSTVGQRGRVLDKTKATEEGTEPNYPIVVLINEGSASASEIVAGALAVNDRAVIVGSRSFGKGSVQTIFNLGEDAALKLTIAEYKPGGTESIQLKGITPDIELIPSTVDLEAMNIVKDKLPTELDLEMRNDKSGKRQKNISQQEIESLLRVSYLKPKEDKKAFEEKSRKEYLKRADLSGDFPVEFAKELILQAGTPTRRKTLEKSGPIVASVQAKQQESIDKALAALGIDWSSAKTKGTPRLDLTYNLTRDGKKIARAKAGDKVNLELIATNKGQGTFYELIGVGESESPYLEGREFPFGKITPGQSRKFSTPIEIPESMPTQNFSMEVVFKDANGVTPEPVRVVVPIVEIPHPSFAFTMSLPSQAKSSPFSMTGKAIPLVVDVRNIGKGTSGEEAVATISNECGEKLFIEKGRVKLGAMPPQGTARAQFKFHMNGEPLEKECALKLTLADIKHLTFLTKRIELKLDKGELQPAVGKIYAAPSIEVDEFPTTTDKSTVILTGKITDKDPIRDFYLFAGEEKITYVPNADGTTTMPFKVAIPLEEGQNKITIGARDIQDIPSYKYLVIERTKASRVAGAEASASIPNFTP